MQKKKFFKIFFCFCLVLMNIFSSIPNLNKLIVFADSVGSYSNVLEDLQKDETFKIDSYPVVEDDYSLKVIQIAESVNNELFIYVYQPGMNTTATSINISQDTGEALSPKNYKLKLINSNEVFYKYKVEDLQLRITSLRTYEIISIFRPFIEGVDEPAQGGNTIDEVSFEVAQQWQAYTYNGKVLYQCLETETIMVTDKFVGFTRYGNVWADWIAPDMDSHFVAFSTDKPIEKLYEADVMFVSQYQYLHTASLTGRLIWANYDNPVEHSITLKHSDVVSYGEGIWLAKKYEWNRILTSEEFIEKNTQKNIYNHGLLNVETESNINEEALKTLKEKQWVLSFFESKYSYNNSSGVFVGRTIVSEVTILRLKFETDRVVYNLGVIDNKQSGDGTPDNFTKTIVKLPLWVKIVLIILALILFILLLVFIKPIAQFVWFIIKWTFKILWYVLLIIWYFFTWPFYLIYKNKGGGS